MDIVDIVDIVVNSRVFIVAGSAEHYVFLVAFSPSTSRTSST